MHAIVQPLRAWRWRWTLGGLLASLCSIFLVPTNFAGIGPLGVWLLWLLFPYGMCCDQRPWMGPLDPIIWLGAPTLYGLVLSATARTRLFRLGCYALLIVHTAAVCFAAFS